jgi:hypothetical protein
MANKKGRKDHHMFEEKLMLKYGIQNNVVDLQWTGREG